MAGESLTFDIFANDRASETFRRLGRSASDASGNVRTLGDRLDKLGTRVATARVELKGDKEAQSQLDRLDVKLIALGRRTANPNIDVQGVARAQADISAVDLMLDRLNKKVARPSILNRLTGGLLGSGGGAAAGAPAAAPAGGGALASVGPYGIAAAAVAAIASLPFLAQAAATGITVALGGAFTAIAAYGASKTKIVQKQFADLKTSAGNDLRKIGEPFAPAMANIIKTAGHVLDQLTPVFRAASKIIAGPFQQFADSLLKSFNQPAVAQSIKDIASAFGAILKALAPQLPGDIRDIATGITRIANVIKNNPRAFADFISFLFHAIGFAFSMIAALGATANYIEKHFIPALMRIVGVARIVGNAFSTMQLLVRWVFDQVTIFAVRAVFHILDAFSHIPVIGNKFKSARDAAHSELNKLQGDSTRTWNAIQNGLDGLHGKRVNLQAQVVFPAGSGYTQLKHKYPGFAGGTSGAAPGLAWVGERGPELVAFHGGEQVYSHQQSRKIGGYAAGTPSPHFTGQWPTQIHGAMGALQGMVGSIASDVKRMIGVVRMTAPMPKLGRPGLYPSSGGVARWRGDVLQVLAMLGQSPAWADSVLTRIANESGGNPNAINLWDSNAAAGDPSRGLMQTIGSTFNAYAGPFRGRGIYDPLANIYAGVNYALHRYGSLSIMTQPGGYDKGGWLMPGTTLAVNKTGRPERVLGPHEAVRVVLEVRSGGSRLDDALVEIIRHAVKVRGGGNVQVALGRRGA